MSHFETLRTPRLCKDDAPPPPSSIPNPLLFSILRHFPVRLVRLSKVQNHHIRNFDKLRRNCHWILNTGIYCTGDNCYIVLSTHELADTLAKGQSLDSQSLRFHMSCKMFPGYLTLVYVVFSTMQQAFAWTGIKLLFTGTMQCFLAIRRIGIGAMCFYYCLVMACSLCLWR